MTEEERIKALEEKLMKAVRALIAYTESGLLTRLRMDFYATGVMPNLVSPRKK
ncbi:MAG: hypothetical protein ABSG73_12915 [Candidatus Aminicenantales bacterium]|jgi:hypothetical protein